MNCKKQWQKAFFSAFVICTLLINGFPIKAQDIATSEDISVGSSVFVFRQSSKRKQVKTFRNNPAEKTVAQRAVSRKKLVTQTNTVAKVQRKRTQKVDPNKVTINRTPTNTALKIKASNDLAGAAETYLDRNELDNAIDYFKKAIELNPKNQAAKLGLSEAYTRKGDNVSDEDNTEQAMFFYQEAIKLNNQNAAAHAGLAEAFDATDQNDKAIQNYEKALAINANLTEIYAPLGMLYYQKGEITQAENYFNKAAKNSNDFQYYIGLIRYKQNRNEEAIAAFKQTLQANPNSAEAHYYLGEVYDRQDKDKEALAEYNQAVKLNPNYVEAWFDLGVANYNRGRYEEAISAYKQAIRVKNDHGEAHANLADVYRQLAMNAKDRTKRREFFGLANTEYSIAAGLIKRDDKNAADLAELHSNWAFSLGRVGNWNSAIERANTAVAFAPNPTASDYNNVGWAYLNSARQDLIAKRNADAKIKLEKGKIALQKSHRA